MNELSSRHVLLNQQRRVNAGLAGKDSGTTHVTMTSDVMTRLDLTPNFDVTCLPRKIEQLIEQTEEPLHRAILKNYLRHALLEISGYWEQILAPELTVLEPTYRIAERGEVHVLVGQAAVKAFYRLVAETRTNVLAARTPNMCVGDFGVVTEAVWSHMTPAATIRSGSLRPSMTRRPTTSFPTTSCRTLHIRKMQNSSASASTTTRLGISMRSLSPAMW